MAARAAFWASVPRSSAALFYAGVFCIFSAVGFLALTMNSAPLTRLNIFLQVFLIAGFSVLWAAAGVRRKWAYMPLIGIAEFAVFWFVGVTIHVVDRAAALDAAPRSLVLGLGGILTLVAGYILFIVCFSVEGRRYFRAHTEIALAREIHQALVPPIQRTTGLFELYGVSVPSGEVGGDLVDLVPENDGWTGYVADVSGHGVSPGVLMAMFKTAVRTRMLDGCPAGHLLEGVHQAIYPLKTSNMFVTAGFLRCQGEELTLSLAGHPALLHYRKQTADIIEYPPQDLPVGILPEQSFGSQPVRCAPGDILVLLTDGFTEVFDQHGDERGVEPLKSDLRQSADLPLPRLFAKLREASLRFGKQEDDQTMLLIRRLAD